MAHCVVHLTFSRPDWRRKVYLLRNVKNLWPTLPKTIGIVTSATGAAIRDVLTVLKRRFPAIEIIVYPTSVQGNVAAKQIANAIAIANLRRECEVITDNPWRRFFRRFMGI